MGVVYADVVARVQERAARAAADELKRQFAEVGDSVGRETSDRIDTSLRGTLPRVAQQAGAEFMGGFGDAIRSGIPGISGSLGGISTVLKGIGTDGAAAGLAASAGIAAIAVAAVKAGEALYGVGARFDAVFDGIAIRTGKAAQDLDALSQSVRNVYTSTASSLEQIGDIGARLSQSLNVSGSPLEDLTQQVANLNRMTGEDLNIRQFGQLLRGFGESSLQAGSDLDALMAASQRTGIPVNELVSTLNTLGPAARSMGMDINESAALIAAFERAGIDADKTVMGLNRAVSQFADNGINLETGLRDTITQLRGFIDAGNEAAAIDLAGKVFGDRAAQRFVDAIRQGALSVDTLQGGLQDTGGTIDRLNEQTADWSEQWDILTNKVDNLAGKLGGPLFDAVNNILGAMNKMLEGDFSGAIVGGPWSGGGGSPGMTFPGGLGGGPNASRERRGLPVGPGAPPQDIAAALAEDARKAAAGLPDAPVLPLPGGYGAGPNPGETNEQWSARMSDLSAQHDLAEKRARLAQIEQTTTATANDVLTAKNAVVEAEMRQLQTAQRYIQSLQQQAAATPEIAFPDGYMQGPRAGQTASQYAAEGNVYEAQQKRAQAEAVYLQLQQSGAATTAELAEAHNNLIAATRAENDASLRLGEAYQDNSEKSRKAAEGLTDVGMKLDADFGISKGLPGIAENIVKFLGNLALAPMFGALQGVQAANGGFDALMGSGLAGIAGLAAGMPFGRGTAATARTTGTPPTIAPYNPDLSGLPSSIAGAGAGSATGARGGAITSGALAGLPLPLPVTIVGGSAGAMSGIAGAMPSAAVGGSSGTWAGDAALLSRVPGGQYAQIQAADLTKGLGDCTSAVEDLVNMMDGRPTAGREMSTGNAASWLSSRGFVPNTTGANVPGAMNVGFRHNYGTGQGHMEATLPDGTNFNWGDAASAASGGLAGAVGAFGDPSFTQHYYRPVGGAMPSATRPSTTMTGGSPTRPSPTGSLPARAGGAGGYAPMTPAELTNPGLSTPRLLGGGAGTGAGMPGLGGAPQSSPFAMGGGADPSQSVIGGRAYGQGTPASGGIGFGGSGLIGLAGSAVQTGIAAAGLAADAAGGGGGGSAGAAIAGAFAQIGIQELQRAVGAGAQYAGALAGGVLETFSLNDSALGDPSKSWLGKLAGVVAGVRPSLPNSAGKEGGAANPNMAEAGKKAEAEKGPPGPLTPQQAEAQKAADAQNAGGQGGNGTTINNQVNVTNQRATEDYTGQVVQAHLGAQAMAGQAR